METEIRNQAQRKDGIKSRKPENAEFIRQAIERGLSVATPAWPLQNTVAVNPFWFRRHERFEDALMGLEPSVRHSLLMPVSYYLERYRKGEIRFESISDAIQAARNAGMDVGVQVDQLLSDAETLAEKQDLEGRGIRTLTDALDSSGGLSEFITAETSKYAAAYLDDRQSVIAFPWRDLPFFQAWTSAQKWDQSMEKAGFSGFSKHCDGHTGMSAEAAIESMTREMGIDGKEEQTEYFSRLTASVLGWGSQFKYAEWQRSLGYPVRSEVNSRDLLAVRLAYDFGIHQELQSSKGELIANWKKSLSREGMDQESKDSFQIRFVLQNALEISYQKSVSSRIGKNTGKRQGPVEMQLAFCIDVRSEMLRRNLEEVCPTVQTIGFAGFFGVPFDYKRMDEDDVGHRLPVLLKPAFHVKEEAPTNDAGSSDSEPLTNGVMRNLRKYPLSSFLYVELFGAMYIPKMLRRTWQSMFKALANESVPERFRSRGAQPSQRDVSLLDGGHFGIPEKIERARVVLQHLGLTDNFAPLVMIVGHGSQTTNNALGSALDCGACGGHAGDINARFLADLLNDQKVRSGLSAQGIVIPEDTVFVAALHETVTDEIHVLETDGVPEAGRSAIGKLSESFKKASEMTRVERFHTRSDVIDPNAERRSQNWAEIRPEWGLAGNACFIVAPRSRTLGVNLESRSFLHDYDWRKDATRGFATLELIMTAPMVVTNWINMQYYASSVAPKVYGSGNKVLHNLTNENGVVEGNGGDLKVGLSFQSVHDGERLVHDPLRLSVFIEAPREEIEKIIARHEVVRELLDHGWINFVHIEPEEADLYRRLPGGIYSAI